MAYADLREFVKRLEKEGELKRIRVEVDPILEIAEVTQRVARDVQRAPNSVGPALLFEMLATNSAYATGCTRLIAATIGMDA